MIDSPMTLAALRRRTETIDEAVHDAVLAERERCAKIAETEASRYNPKGWDGEGDSHHTALEIAAEIRKGG